MGTADTPAEPMSGLMVPPESTFISLAINTPPAVPTINAATLKLRSVSYPIRGMWDLPSMLLPMFLKDCYNVYQGIGSGVGQTQGLSAFLKQVPQHQHTHKRRLHPAVSGKPLWLP